MIWGSTGPLWLFKADDTVFAEDNLQRVVEIMGEMEQPLQLLDRRGIDIGHLQSQGLTEDNRLPRFRVHHGDTERWFFDRDASDAFVRGLEAEHEANTPAATESDVDPEAPKDGETEAIQAEAEAGPICQVVDLHEVKSLNENLAALKDFGLGVGDFVTGGFRNAEQIFSFRIDRNEQSVNLASLRDLLPALRRLGEKGLTLTRFKGLGEMNSDELWETSMDPEKRTLLQVTMEDAAAADEIFRILMGDQVEPRREFIAKHALDVKDLDV